jgi:ApaG protein
MYAQTTHSVKVTVVPQYLEQQSTPADSHYVWAYHVRIENVGGDTVQLLARHWRITDSNGGTHEVVGEGVVGEQPVLGPGEKFEYTSGTPLATPSGIMSGSYRMISKSGESFDVEIPAFSLDSPHNRVSLN